MKKKVLIISNFHENAIISRSNMAYKYFLEREFITTVLYSNFSHSLKKFRYFKNEDFIPISTIEYSSSLSLKRILSYLIFSFKVFKYIRKSKFDIIYVNLPPNILAIAVLLNRRRGVKIILDILDLWPESFPLNKGFFKKVILLVFSKILGGIRGITIRNSDYCITESKFFFKKLNLNEKKGSKTILLKKFQSEPLIINDLSDEISIVYLGNLGNIYDFDSLFKIIKGVEKNRLVHLHIIGLGPISNWFFSELDTQGINYTYHGASFDESLKREILSSCWFGFNGYKDNTEVALSYKSIDYLSYGVPLINSAKEDTFNLVAEEKIGFNFSSKNIDELIIKLATISFPEVIDMKKKSYSVFQNKFSGESYYKEMDLVINSL
jgi:glycosyltransferase involved in cell wall biosynthesis